MSHFLVTSRETPNIFLSSASSSAPLVFIEHHKLYFTQLSCKPTFLLLLLSPYHTSPLTLTSVHCLDSWPRCMYLNSSIFHRLHFCLTAADFHSSADLHLTQHYSSCCLVWLQIKADMLTWVDIFRRKCLLWIKHIKYLSLTWCTENPSQIDFYFHK